MKKYMNNLINFIGKYIHPSFLEDVIGVIFLIITVATCSVIISSTCKYIFWLFS